MKKNIEILGSEHKITKAGKPFMRFNTSLGWMSCFDEKESKKLKEFEGGIASCELVESGEFKNIKKCYGAGSEEVGKVTIDGQEVDMPPQVIKMNGNVVPKNTTTMYVSYAKDIFCALLAWDKDAKIDESMETAIVLVKQAKEAFE